VNQSLHTGAHIDSPLHVFKNGITTAEISLDQVMGEALVVDLSWVGANHSITIDDAFVAERRRRYTGLGVERDHLIARGHVNDAAFGPVGPIRETAARELARRRFAALAFLLAVHPDHFAARRIERDDRAPSTGRRVDDGVDWKLNSWRGPSESVLKRHATSSLSKFSFVI
jgi:hypothetical protein